EKAPESRSAWESGRADRLERLRWLLGEAPLVTTVPPTANYGRERVEVSVLMDRPMPSPDSGVEATRLNLGQYIPAMGYHPTGAMERGEQGEKLPLAIWLHPDSITKGFGGAYIRPEKMPMPIVHAGFAAMAYDQIGSGYRLAEARYFHDRYPRWSILGKM